MKQIRLSGGHIALVDSSDFDRLSKHRWTSNKKGRNVYASRTIRLANGREGAEYMHRVLMPGACEVHHKNGDCLDNRKSNLRSVTRAENMRGVQKKRLSSTSDFRGVCWDSSRKKWKSGLRLDGKTINLGRFSSEKEAAEAYDKAALVYFKDFASPNFNPKTTRS